MQALDPNVFCKAYPDYVSKIDGNCLVFYDGSKMDLGRISENFDKKLNNPSLMDQISIPYLPGRVSEEFLATNKTDPGRFRYIPFFLKIYGASAVEVEKNLVEIDWMPKAFGKNIELSSHDTHQQYKILVTQANGVAKKFSNISASLDELNKDGKYTKYLENPGGTFLWRNIEGTNRLSAHSFGMTIDINVAFSSYWLWDMRANNPNLNMQVNQLDMSKIPRYKNQIPWEIIEIFEKNHFIWGGKWHHYDTMHFEYRPEFFVEY
ncbi:MAG: M15 family metallopeptidase [Rickettsiaceae bacterium]|nr:M15 family metallopeptidase [Rickettsiaceae bacterium]